MENDNQIEVELEAELLAQVEPVCSRLGITVENAVQLFIKKICEEKELLDIVAEALKV